MNVEQNDKYVHCICNQFSYYETCDVHTEAMMCINAYAVVGKEKDTEEDKGSTMMHTL